MGRGVLRPSPAPQTPSRQRPAPPASSGLSQPLGLKQGPPHPFLRKPPTPFPRPTQESPRK